MYTRNSHNQIMKMKKEKEREISAIFKRFHVATLTKKSKYIALHMRGEWPKDSWTRLFPPPKKVGFLILLPSHRQNSVVLSALYVHASLPPNNPFIAHNIDMGRGQQGPTCGLSSPTGSTGASSRTSTCTRHQSKGRNRSV